MAFIAYLLGVLLTKWEIDHGRRGIKLYFPLTRKAVVKDLKAGLGGFSYTVVTASRSYLIYELSSRKDLLRLLWVVRRCSTTIPPSVATKMIDWLTTTLQRLSRRRKIRRVIRRPARSV
jgi:hypothetical protein